MKRRRLSPSARAAMLERQGGTCIVEGCAETRGLIEEHSTPFTWTGELPDQLMCVAHHKAKTRRDIANIAKAKRLNGATSSQESRRKKRGFALLKGRGFDRSLKKKMNGEVIRRG
jgi:hypothetical protein